ncbi:hypothetical protein KAI65_01865 [Candidatus Parcubacteria bacterium]|nr:hypothetical protein [Candidatus Parcubacteria bacterium]
MIKSIINNLSNVSLSKKRGRFLSDKSYGYDTVFFIAKLILRNCDGNKFNKQKLRPKAISFIEDIFNLSPGTAGAVNYFVETLNLLDFGNILEKEGRNTYKIVRKDILEYICENPENAYIFIYLLTFYTYKNDGLLGLLNKYCQTKDISEKEKIIYNIFNIFQKKSISIGATGSNWSKQLVKYSLIIFGYVNNQYYLTRTLKIKPQKITIEDVSLNVKGTRTPDHLPKKNDYIQSFSIDYVLGQLEPYLFVKSKIDPAKTVITKSLASDLADLKLDIFNFNAVDGVGDIYDQKQFNEFENNIRRRNPSIQSAFRKNLLKHNNKFCSICKFTFEKFLIAGHIKPYTMCDNTYDAINHFNGLLLCPNHDKLFEGAKYMTIDSSSGKIILNDTAKCSKDFITLDGQHIDKRMVHCERKHYLRWHNEQFYKQNT